MRKLLNGIFLGLLIISCGCKDNSREGKIKRHFKEYIEINFGNPSDVKDITQIELEDSISTMELKKMVLECVEMAESASQTHDSLSNRCKYLVNTTPYGESYYGIIKRRGEAMSLLQKKADFLGQMIQKYFNKEIDELKVPAEIENYPDTVLYKYKIKYRIIVSDKPEIREIYATTGTDVSKVIFDTKGQINEDGIKDFAKECKKSIDNSNVYLNIYKELCIIDSQLLNILEESLKEK